MSEQIACQFPIKDCGQAELRGDAEPARECVGRFDKKGWIDL